MWEYRLVWTAAIISGGSKETMETQDAIIPLIVLLCAEVRT